jgi:hypothetical protein
MGIAAAIGSSSEALSNSEKAQNFFELRNYLLRRDIDVARIHQYFERDYLPEMRRQGLAPIGCFNVVTGQPSPSLLLLLQYDSLAKVKANTDLAAATGEFSQAWTEFESSQLPYIRYESTLLKAFSAYPALELPPASEKRKLFELRIYESKNAVKSAAKIEMFNLEEIKIFKDCGMHIVFLGEGLFGTGLPQMTYMLAFEDMEDRASGWQRFSRNKDWNRIKEDPRWLDTVSSIHSSYFSPTEYSDIQ